jgi:hypothetical protein
MKYGKVTYFSMLNKYNEEIRHGYVLISNMPIINFISSMPD